MKRKITSIAVLGSGLMGSALAAHFAGCGFEVLLLDLASEGPDRNKGVNESLRRCLTSKPSNIYSKKFASRIKTGNFEDDLQQLRKYDWILEVIIEKLEIKKDLYEKIEPYRKTGSLISSNTSGIPINLLTEGRSEDFKKHFCGTHFFNPPRYLRLLEVIPTHDTDPEVTRFMMSFGAEFLGKQTVLCKDTPAFIANRIGVVSMSKAFELTQRLGLSVQVVDKLSGPALGRPKSGTFRLTDIVGLDTAVMVIRDLQKNCPEDKHVQQLNLPGCIDFLLQNKWFGDKSGKGFYEKTNRKDDKGKPVILGLDLSSQQHVPEVKSDLESLKLSRQIEDLSKRLRALIQCNDAGGEFIRQTLGFLLAYTADRIPEITENLYAVDDAMKNGYAWELGPFEYWDAIGLEMGLELIRASGETPSNWVVQMQSNGVKSFYQHSDGMLTCYNPVSGKYDPVPDVEKKITINLLAGEKLVYSNPELKLWDIGEGVLCAEFCSKYNAIGEGILNGLNESVRIAEEQQWQGLVIGNNAPNFTVGANLMLIGMLAFQQEYDQLDMAVRLFQNTSMRLRYSSIPVIAVTQGYVFGGGTEFLMHCDGAVCAAESYIGLVEVGVGLIPGGGGTKEFAMRFADEIREGEVMIPQLIQKFRTIATASVATSAFEAYDLGYLSAQRDVVSLDLKAAIYHGKQKVIQLAPHYIRPLQRTEVMVLGRSGLGTLQAAAHTMYRGGYASEHDVKIANKIAYVLCGGDLSAPQMVSEQYLLDLEREAFLSLCTEPKTMERIQFMLENNKPLRN
ncbi:MAG: 3-hydroxyacyl-CoA dehydrogenase/enoyl-CoA hydratase family protein [Saprospiraceae bacterium]|nr:3-hydroxyacyl-CoA dehydrogenase/enoyl-CoA hydratase family protein [Saprospiraceae bacterium]HMZ39860.1 3-hydroxyacyl-CoA dehydrogenase/enoyl-CoA hydratase family protein [Saprospiraceae bacterium]HNB31869.1 3-hydroxyacyl-CoA dehydrogenase/enoyl-CoA hydratase family protein [Saprospiraceae bacterium]HNE62758.1 3-hydroxyacyl-CoA dehydrogenase/enoyl-CoA hydratase family protein [Saprospiraceae bacterium]HNF11073.1 3-hydroxyacyl-CoA dehydrogenase/enoyl-CoA hydratase family protein [Saprospirace